MTCLLTYPVMSGALLLYRNDGPARSVAKEATSVTRIARQPAVGLDIDPAAVIANYFTCDPKMVDLSYYGEYDKRKIQYNTIQAQIS